MGWTLLCSLCLFVLLEQVSEHGWDSGGEQGRNLLEGKGSERVMHSAPPIPVSHREPVNSGPPGLPLPGQCPPPPAQLGVRGLEELWPEPTLLCRVP